MNRPARVIQATWLLMLALQTIGSVDMKHRLPAPRQFVSISVLWSLLFLAADSGLGRIAARLSVLILLTASVIGPFGTRLVSWLRLIAQNFGIPPVQSTSTDAQASPSEPVLT